MTYLSLDPAKIGATAHALARGIEGRFPGRGLAAIAGELCREAEDASRTARDLAHPVLWARLLAWALILIMGVFLVSVFLVAARNVQLSSSLADFFQGFDAAVNELILFGIASYFLISIEGRVKRRQALEALHELRSLAHVIDMHQVSKGVEDLLEPAPVEAPASPSRLTARELAQYLDYCSEMLSLLSKIAALYVQDFRDPVTLRAVDEVQQLTIGLSQKIWQKIRTIDDLAGTRAACS